VTHCKNMLMGHFRKLQKYNVPIDNVQLAKWQVKQVSFSHSSKRQQRVRISYLGCQTVPSVHCCDSVWCLVCKHECAVMFCFFYDSCFKVSSSFYDRIKSRKLCYVVSVKWQLAAVDRLQSIGKWVTALWKLQLPVVALYKCHAFFLQYLPCVCRLCIKKIFMT